MPASTRAHARRARYRRRRLVVFGSLAVVILAIVYVTTSLVAPLPATAAVADKAIPIAAPAAQLTWPGFGASAVTVLNYPGVSESNGSAASMPIASITKTITSLVVLNAKPISANSSGPNISFTQKDVDILHEVQAEDGSWAPVVAGTTLTEKQALTAMLLPSANNYAISLATWAYGSVPAFISAANTWLAAHKLTATHLVDADGLDPGSVSSTADLLSIGTMVHADPTLSSIVDLKQATLPGAGTVKNTNDLLGSDGINGIKTGNTDQAGDCLMFTAHKSIDGHPIVVLGVVLGAASHAELWASVKSLLNSVTSGFHEVSLTHPGEVFGTYTTAWRAKSTLVSTTSKSMLVWSNTPVSVTVVAQPVIVGTAGDVVGQAMFTRGTAHATAALSLGSAIAGPGFGWRLAHPGGWGA